MPVETGVTEISDLNELWPLGGDPRSDGDNHLRIIKVALKSLLTNPGQLGLPTALSFADGESVTLTPSSGAATLANSPSPAASLVLVRNGVIQRAGTDFTLAGAALTLTPVVADASEWMLAWYRY